MKINNGTYPSIEELTQRYLNGSPGAGRATENKAVESRSFADILTEKQQGVIFTKHAAERLSDRNIVLDERQLERLNDGVKRANEKGINDSLVMVDNLAFIVNTGSKKVVTAMDANDTKTQVFSNIDGAVIA